MNRPIGSIRRLDAYADVVRRLVEEPHPATGSPIFVTFRDLACFAAVLGFDERRRIVVDGPSSILVDGRIFANSEVAVDLLHLLGLAVTRDPDVLLDNEEQGSRLVDEFEAHANGGLAILSEWLAADPGDAHGDRAILAALRDRDLLSSTPSAADLDSVTF